MTIEVDCVLKIMMCKSFRPVSVLLMFSFGSTLHKIMIGEYRIKIGRVRRSFVFYCYTHSLTHSLTQTDNIVAYARGSKLQKACETGIYPSCFKPSEGLVFLIYFPIPFPSE